MNGQEINDIKGPLPVEQDNPEEKQPDAWQAYKAVNPDKEEERDDDVEDRKPE